MHTSSSSNGHNGGTLRQGANRGAAFDDYDDDDPEHGLSDSMAGMHVGGPDAEQLDDGSMLDSVILPIFASVSELDICSWCHPMTAIMQLFPRVTTEDGRIALSKLRQSFIDAERLIPGVTSEIVNEIVDSVENVEDDAALA